MENKEHNTISGTTPERRKNRERRVCSDRRSADERRTDSRESGPKTRRSIRSWIRSKTNARLGVDRRKGERRRLQDRRIPPRSILTKEEIHDLLSP